MTSKSRVGAGLTHYVLHGMWIDFALLLLVVLQQTTKTLTSSTTKRTLTTRPLKPELKQLSRELLNTFDAKFTSLLLPTLRPDDIAQWILTATT
jgi:hypothetical protein